MKKNREIIEEKTEIKKVEIIEESKKVNIPREVKFKVSEWAIQENIDPLLFKKWENEMMTKQEFEKLRNERGA